MENVCFNVAVKNKDNVTRELLLFGLTEEQAELFVDRIGHNLSEIEAIASAFNQQLAVDEKLILRED